MKLRSHLIVAISAAILPVLIFSTVLVVVLARQQRASVMEGLVETARALALALDRDITGVIVALRALGSSEQLTSGDLEAFHRQAARVVAIDPTWLAIVLVDPTGRQLLHTAVPYGAPLPTWRDQAFVREAVDTEAPRISDAFVGPVTQRLQVTIAAPLVHQRSVRYVLAASVDAHALSRLLGQQRFPSEWTAAVLDRGKTIIARNRAAEQFVGTPATPDLAAQSSAAAEGIYRATTKEGDAVYAAFSRSGVTGWTVALGVPAAIIDASLHRSLWT
ncbi:MAG: cache domain-containing protein, partial [Candidatus Rokuibacteriota bacterium]